jgi:hypothetical protein
VSPFQDFAASGLDAQQIQVDIDALGPGSSPATDHWAAVVFGATPGSFIIGKGTGVLLRDSGQYAVFDNGKMVSSGSVGSKATPQQFYTIDFSILDPSTGQYALAINGKMLFRGTHGQYTTNYLTLEDSTSAAGSGTQFDYFANLTISTNDVSADSSIAQTNTTYYVSPQGDDNNAGTSPETAWRTIDQVNKVSFRPGDQILFQGGATFGEVLSTWSDQSQLEVEQPASCSASAFASLLNNGS